MIQKKSKTGKYLGKKEYVQPRRSNKLLQPLLYQNNSHATFLRSPPGYYDLSAQITKPCLFDRFLFFQCNGDTASCL